MWCLDLTTYFSRIGISTSGVKPPRNIPKTTKIFAITGASDSNTQDVLAKDYVKSLTDLNISAQYKSLPFVDHNKVNEIYVIEEALNELLK